MTERKENIVDLSYDFAVRVVKLCKIVSSERKERVLSKQLLRSGTSIGANVKESQNAESGADFVHKLSIALKEAGETEYWLRLLRDGEFLSGKEYDSINNDLMSVIKMLTSIINTKKKKMRKG